MLDRIAARKRDYIVTFLSRKLQVGVNIINLEAINSERSFHRVRKKGNDRRFMKTAPFRCMSVTEVCTRLHLLTVGRRLTRAGKINQAEVII